MVQQKTLKKRSLSESAADKKTRELSTNVNIPLKKKKTENGLLVSKGTNKPIKKVISKTLKNETKSNKTVMVQRPKKETNDNVKEKSKKPALNKEDKKLNIAKKRQEFREKRKENKAEKVHGIALDLSADEIKKKIKMIENRGDVTKTAKRRLAALRKKLRTKEGAETSMKVTKKQMEKAENKKSTNILRKKQIQNSEKKKVQGKVTSKLNIKNKKQQDNVFLSKQKNKDESEDEEEVDLGETVSEDEDELDLDAKVGSDVNDDDQEEEDEEEDEEEEEEEEDDDDDEEDEDEDEDEDEIDDDEDDDDDNNDNDDDDGDGNDDDDNQVDAEDAKEGDDGNKSKKKTDTVLNAKEGNELKNTEVNNYRQKKHIVFVGNVPYTITMEEIKKHFLSKVDDVVGIRIPKRDGNTGRGFAYVELANETDFEKALSLHQTMLSGRKINVLRSENKRVGGPRNFKPYGQQRIGGRFQGGWNRNHRFTGDRGRQNMRMTRS